MTLSSRLKLRMRRSYRGHSHLETTQMVTILQKAGTNTPLTDMLITASPSSICIQRSATLTSVPSQAPLIF